MSDQPNNPLHGITLEKILTYLVEVYGWEYLGENFRMNCFMNNPTIKSSLVFLRKTPWARKKVEDFYVYSIKNQIVRKQIKLKDIKNKTK